jgi:hypothetical protein
MTKADIHISVERDQEDVTNITWQAEESPEPGVQNAKAMILALWDAESRNSLRIDLWSKDTTYSRATNNKDIMADMKIFAREFAEKASRAARKMK